MKRFSVLLSFLLLIAACDADPSPQETEERWGTLPPSPLEVVASFDATLGQTPESVATDFDGNVYVSSALSGQVFKIDSQGQTSVLATLPLGNPEDCLGPFPGIMGALAIDVVTKDLFLPVNSCDLEAKGIYRVSQSGETTLIAGLPPEALGNGIGLRLGRVYVSDSGSTRIFRASTSGDGSPAEVWTDEPLLADPDPFDIIPGANGLQFYGGTMYVANAGAQSIVGIDMDFPLDGSGDIQPDGSFVFFGPPETNPVWETDPTVAPGCDDFAFDLFGNIYCTTDPFQTVVRYDVHDGSTEILFTAADGLDGPTAAAFGRGQDRNTLYISNAQFPFFPPAGNGPSVLKTTVFPGGYPLR